MTLLYFLFSWSPSCLMRHVCAGLRVGVARGGDLVYLVIYVTIL